MKYFYSKTLILFFFAFEIPLIATAQNNFSIEELKSETEHELQTTIPLYRAGSLTDPNMLRSLIGSLEFLDRYEEAYQILETEIDSGRLEDSANNNAKLAYYLRRQSSFPESVPYLRKAVELGHPTAQIQLAETIINIEQTSRLSDCGSVKKETEAAIAAGMPNDVALMYNGSCHFDRAKQLMEPNCPENERTKNSKLPSEVAAEIRVSKAIFKTIPKGSDQRKDAKKWLSLFKMNESVLIRALCSS